MGILEESFERRRDGLVLSFIMKSVSSFFWLCTITTFYEEFLTSLRIDLTIFYIH